MTLDITLSILTRREYSVKPRQMCTRALQKSLQKSLVSAPAPLRGQRRCALCTPAFRLRVVWASEARPNHTQTPQWLRRRRKAIDFWISEGKSALTVWIAWYTSRALDKEARALVK